MKRLIFYPVVETVKTSFCKTEIHRIVAEQFLVTSLQPVLYSYVRTDVASTENFVGYNQYKILSSCYVFGLSFFE
jgi:hypothetical protein